MGKLGIVALALAASAWPVLSLPALPSAQDSHVNVSSTLVPVGINNAPHFSRRARRYRPYAKRDYDLSPKIKKLAAIGDSFSAGIGAGEREGGITDVGAWACSRCDNSYPRLFSKDPAFGKTPPKFQFESCSGAVSTEIKDEQVDRIDNDQDAILLSAGGNDAFFVDIINQCVFQIFAPNKVTAGLMDVNPAIHGTVGDVSKYARTCEDTLKDVEKFINSVEYSSNLDKLLEKTKTKLAKDGKIFYTGYAKFWAEDMSKDDQCSNINWSVFLSNADKWSFQPPSNVQLTVDRRIAMNSLVDKINSKIAEVVKRAGNQVVFVDWDSDLDDAGRFCAPGVQEPDTKRDNLWFYELDINDPLGSTNFKRDGEDLYQGTFEYDMDKLGGFASTVGSKLDNKILKGNMTDDDHGKRKFNYLPNGYGRVFHPTKAAHKKIVAKLISAMVKAFNLASSGGSNGRPSACRYPRKKSKPTCTTKANDGITAKDFIEARDTFCADTSKTDSIVTYRDREKNFELSLKKSGGSCPKDDCVKTLNKVWNTCGDFHSRPEKTGDDGLDAHYGPFRSTGKARGKCGVYSYKKTDPEKKEEPSTPVLTAELGNVSPYPSSNCNGDHNKNDVNEYGINKDAKEFCEKYKDTELKDGMDIMENLQPDHYVKNIGGFKPVPWYHITVSYKDGCKMNPSTATLDTLVKDYTCVDLLFRNWREARGNKGRGGTSQIGCVDTSYKIQCVDDK